MKEFFKKYSKQLIWLCAVLAVVVIVATGYLVYLKIANKDIVAKVGDRTVTKTAYTAAYDRCVAVAEYSKEENTKKTCDKTALETKVLIAALENEAEKFGIKVESSEIDKKYNSEVESYGGEENLLATYAQLKSTKESIKEAFKLDLLKEKLASKILAEKEVYGVFLRWDWYKDAGSIAASEQEAKKITLDNVNKYFTPILDKNSFPTNEVIDQKIKDFGTSNPLWSPFWRAGTFEKNGLNAVTAKDDFVGDAEWDGLKNLKKGDVSKPIVSDGGYVVIYRVLSDSEGKYSGWDQYLDSVLNTSKIYSYSYSAQRSLLTAMNFSKNMAAAVVSQVPVVGKAYAADIVCSTNHFSRLDVANTIVLGTTSSFTPDRVEWGKGSNGECPACKSPVESCSGTYYPSGPKWDLGDKKDADRKWLSCWVMWNIKVEKEGYRSIKWFERNVAPNGSATYLDKSTDGVAAYFKEWDGNSWENGSSELHNSNTNGNGTISMRPQLLLTVTIAGNGRGHVTGPSVGCGNDGYGSNCTARMYPASSNTYIATADSTTSSFVSWSGCNSVSGTSCAVSPMGGSSRTITATFVRTNQAPTIVPNSPTGTFSLDSTSNINADATISDADGDQVRGRVAISKSTDGGNTWVSPVVTGMTLTRDTAWTYTDFTALYGQGSRHNFISFLPSAVGVGYYKAVFIGQDSRGLYTAPAGSPNAWTHNQPMYFTVVDPNQPLACPAFGNLQLASTDPDTTIAGNTVTGIGAAKGTLSYQPVGGNYKTYYTRWVYGTQKYPTSGDYSDTDHGLSINYTTLGDTAVSFYSRIADKDGNFIDCATQNSVIRVVQSTTTCSVRPATGSAPLVATITANIENQSGNYTYSIYRDREKTTQYSSSSIPGTQFLKTLYDIGNYYVFVSRGTKTVECGYVNSSGGSVDHVTVTSPGTGGGGEIAPQ